MKYMKCLKGVPWQAHAIQQLWYKEVYRVRERSEGLEK